MLREKLEVWLSVNVWKLPRTYSRKEIADEIQVSKSPSLLRELNTLVQNEVLDEVRGKDEQGRDIIRYRFNQDWTERQFASAGVKKNV